jgi:dienelactone hydrolase
VVVAALACIALAAFLAGACSAVRASRLLQDALDPPADLAERIEMREVAVPTRAGDVPVLVFRPRGATGPLPGVVLVHGAVDAGARESRLQAFARSFAARGAVVATPHLSSLAAFRLDADDPRRVADVGLWLTRNGSGAGTVALAGVSVGASYAILAADDAVLRDRVVAVLSFGAYADLDALLFRWMTNPAPAPGLFDPLTTGRRLVLLGNVDRFVPPTDREAVSARIAALLAGRTMPAEPVSAEAQAVVDVAVSTAPLDPAGAREFLAHLATETQALSPVHASAPSAAVHLLHGADDPIVPSEDLDTLAAALAARGVRVSVHRTEVFAHVDAEHAPGLLEAWPLLRFVGSFLDDAGL